MDQVDYTACVWFHSKARPTCLRLIIPEVFLDQPDADVQVHNAQILALKFLCLRYKFPEQRRIERTQCLLRFSADKKEVLQLLSHFDLEKDLKYYLQLLILGKYRFITQMKSGV